MASHPKKKPLPTTCSHSRMETASAVNSKGTTTLCQILGLTNTGNCFFSNSGHTHDSCLYADLLYILRHQLECFSFFFVLFNYIITLNAFCYVLSISLFELKLFQVYIFSIIFLCYPKFPYFTLMFNLIYFPTVIKILLQTQIYFYFSIIYRSL